MLQRTHLRKIKNKKVGKLNKHLGEEERYFIIKPLEQNLEKGSPCELSLKEFGKLNKTRTKSKIGNQTKFKEKKY